MTVPASGNLRVAGVGGVERGDANDEAEDDAGPECSARDQHGGRVAGGPVGDVDSLAAGEALVEFHGGEDAAQDERKQRADGGKDDDGDEQREQAGQEAGELDEHPVHRVSEREYDLLTHGGSPSRYEGQGTRFED
jgi:hypothetical protein